jgi:ABC-type transport system involved in multi-copper enzyme maturation permease subunit
MILLVARRELLGHMRSVRLRALFALAVALLATGAYVNVRRYDARVRYADALEALRAVTVATEREDPETIAARYGWRSGRVSADPALRAIRPPAPASIFAAGADLAAPGYWQFGTEGVSAGPAVDADDTGAAARATLDLEFIVRAVLSLVALLLAADSVAGDRERGLLRTLFAAPVSRLDIVLGKYLGGLLAMCVPLCVGGLAAVAVAAAMGAPVVGAALAPRLLLLTCGSAAFLAAMLALGTCVSARCRDAHTAVVVLVALWAMAVVVLPGAASLVAAVTRPVTPDELHRQSRIDGLRQLEAERAHALAAVWRRVSGSDELPAEGPVPPALRRAYDEARRPLDADLMRRKRTLLWSAVDQRRRERERQERLAALVEAVSPAASFAAFAAGVSGTGPRAVERWERAVDDQQRRLEGAMFDRSYGTELFAALRSFLRITYLPDQTSPAERVPRYDELPSFVAPSPDLAADVRAALPALGVLLIDSLLFLSLAAVAVVRMEV